MTGVYVRALDAKPEEPTSHRVLTTGFGATYVPDVAPGIGRLLFVRDATLFAQPFDAGRLQLSGDAVRVGEPVGSFLDGAFFSASTNGVLVFRGPDEDRQLTWFDRGGKILGPASEPGRYSGLTLGPSETRAVVVKQANQATADQDLWVMELSQSRSSRLTFDSRLEESPVWSHDGRRVFFTGTGTAGSLFEQSLSGTDPAQLLLQNEEHKVPTSASSDGRFLLYTSVGKGPTRFDLWVLPLKGDRKPFPFLRREYDQEQGQFSPDGRWVAYVSNESGRDEVLVRPFTSAGAAGADRELGGLERWRHVAALEGRWQRALLSRAERNHHISRLRHRSRCARLALREPCSKSLEPIPRGLSPGTANGFCSPCLPGTPRRRRSRSCSTGRRL